MPRHDRAAYALEPYWSRDGDDTSGPGYPAPRYVCASGCRFEGGWMAALEHHVQQAHEIRVKHSGPGWPNVLFPQPYVARMRDRLAKQAEKDR